MKKYFITLFVGILLVLISGCTKFEPATVDASEEGVQTQKLQLQERNQ